MFKFKRGLPLALIKEMTPQNRYKLQNNIRFTLRLVKSVHKGIESLSYLGPNIWKFLPFEIKQTESLLKFKST